MSKKRNRVNKGMKKWRERGKEERSYRESCKEGRGQRKRKRRDGGGGEGKEKGEEQRRSGEEKGEAR